MGRGDAQIGGENVESEGKKVHDQGSLHDSVYEIQISYLMRYQPNLKTNYSHGLPIFAYYAKRR